MIIRQQQLKREKKKESGDAAETLRNGVPPPAPRHPSGRGWSGGESRGAGAALPERGRHAVVPLRLRLQGPGQVELSSGSPRLHGVVQHPPPGVPGPLRRSGSGPDDPGVLAVAGRQVPRAPPLSNHLRRHRAVPARVRS